MITLTANQLSQGANQRLGNCVHNRTARLRDPMRLANCYELQCDVQKTTHALHSYFGQHPAKAEDLATANMFAAASEFIAQTTVNVAEGT